MAIEIVDLSIENGDFPYSYVSGITSIQPDWWWTDVLNSTICFLVMDRGVRFSVSTIWCNFSSEDNTFLHYAAGYGQMEILKEPRSVGSRLKWGTLETIYKQRGTWWLTSGCTGVPDLQTHTSVLLLWLKLAVWQVGLVWPSSKNHQVVEISMQSQNHKSPRQTNLVSLITVVGLCFHNIIQHNIIYLAQFYLSVIFVPGNSCKALLLEFHGILGKLKSPEPLSWFQKNIYLKKNKKMFVGNVPVLGWREMLQETPTKNL